MLAHYSPHINGQLVIPPIASAYGDLNEYTEANQLAAARRFGERGIEVQWIDAGWFIGGWPNGAGTWAPKPESFPHGLGIVGEAVHAAGMKFLVWFEIERASGGSRIAREHPEWVIGPITQYGGLFNWGIPEARKWLTDLVSDQIEKGRIDIFRSDYNMEPLFYWERNDPPDRQGMTEITFVEGMYNIWDELRARHPGLWIDDCASGGRLIDLETVMRSIPLWQSDAQVFGAVPTMSQLQNNGLNLYLPLHSGGAPGLEPSYEFRSAMMSGNVLPVYDQPAEQVRETVAAYKRVRPYFEGDYYPLFESAPEETVWYGYQLHRPDEQRGIAVIFRRPQSVQSSAPIGLQAIDPKASYKLTDKDSGQTRSLKGSELRGLAVKIERAPGAKILFYEKD
jgi:alpha-galactosidase